MKVGVLGGTHLAQVTAACLASVGHDVTTYGHPVQVDEPGLEVFQQDSIVAGRLRSAGRGWPGDPGKPSWAEPGAALEEAFAAKTCELLWCCQDTPVNGDDVSNVHAVTEEIQRICQHMPSGSLVIVSSQLPIGTTRKMIHWSIEQKLDLDWVYCPENLRRKHAISDFLHPSRVIIGTDYGKDTRIENLFSSLNVPIVWTGIESAEALKHTLNALLGACITLVNEIAELVEKKQANFAEIERALRSEPRIGRGLPVRAGEGFTGGTLGRDLKTLEKLGKEAGLPMTLVSAILESNARRLSR